MKYQTAQHEHYRQMHALQTVIVLCLCLLFPFKLMAAAGDSISTRATVNYVYQSFSYVQESSPLGNTVVGVGNGSDTVFTEDRLLNFIVNETDNQATSVNSTEAGVVTTFSVTNLGNAPQDLLLAAFNNNAHSLSNTEVDNIDALLPLRAFVESGLTAGYQPGEDIAVFIDELAPGAPNAATVYIVADMPAAAPGDLAAVSLVVQIAAGGAAGEGAAINADNNGNTSPAGTYSNGATAVAAGTPSSSADALAEDIVFNDPAGLNAEDFDSTTAAQDVVRNGQHVATDAYIVEPSEVVINKSVTVIDTLGGNDPHAGATLRYRLDVVITGVGSVDNLVVTDSIPANTTFTAGSITLDGVAQTEADDDGIPSGPVVDYTSLSGAPGSELITVDLGQGGSVSIAPPATRTIIFEVTID